MFGLGAFRVGLSRPGPIPIADIGRAATESYPYDRFPAYRETRDALQWAIIADREEHPLP